MDGKDIQSDFRALKRLYGLLRNDADGTSNTHSDLLDEHSRLVLKNLLDAETKRLLLKVHSEVVAGPPKENQSCEQGKDRDKESKEDGLDVLAQKRCVVCQRSTVKQLESIHSDNDGVVAINSSNAFSDMQKNESDYCLWNSKQGIKSNNDWLEESKSDKGRQGVPYVSNYGDTEASTSKSDCPPKASEAMKQIELCVSDEQLQELFEKNYLVPEIKSSVMPQQFGEDNFMTTSSFLSSQRDVNPLCFPMYYWVPPYLSLSQTCKLFEPEKAMLRQSSSKFIRPALENDMSGKSRDESKLSPKKVNKKVFNENVKAIRDETESRKLERSPISRNRRLQHEESDSYEQSSSINSDSEEYSFTDETGSLQRMSSSSRSSGSWGGSSEAQYSSSCTSNSDEEVYSSSSGDGASQMTSSSSRSEGSTPKKPGPSMIHRAHGINHKKQLGVWRRLKDRLAIVFHHHRHHHHGHRTNDEAKMSHNASLGKHHGKRQDEAYGEKAVGRMKKSVVPEKGQRSHFHGLVEGLLRHVRHSKQSKLVKGADKRHGTNKTLNKSHWWQLLQHHHRGAKFPKTTHVKHRLGKEKARLKALPKVK